MKTNILIFTILISILGCSNTMKRSGTTSIILTPLTGYFVKNTVSDNGETRCFVFFDQTSFSEVCGLAATMTNIPIVPDFTKERVVGIVGTKSDHTVEIRIVKSEIEAGVLIVDFEEIRGDEKLSYQIRPLALATVPKSDINTVVFRKGKQKIAVEEVVW